MNVKDQIDRLHMRIDYYVQTKDEMKTQISTLVSRVEYLENLVVERNQENFELKKRLKTLQDSVALLYISDDEDVNVILVDDPEPHKALWNE